MYSVEIKVERDRLTGKTRVLSANTTLPVDLCHQGVKVYEDEQKGTNPIKGQRRPLCSNSKFTATNGFQFTCSDNGSGVDSQLHSVFFSQLSMR